MTSAIISALHVLALALGLGSVYARGRALRGPLDAGGLRRLFAADSVWGVAALLWLVTGLLRAFGGLEKGTQFYLTSNLFWVKMTLFGIIVLLEIWPMVTFIRWRVAAVAASGRTPRARKRSTSSITSRWGSWWSSCSSPASWPAESDAADAMDRDPGRCRGGCR